MKKSRYLTAKEATQLLGVTPATLYAYVSRGLIRSETLDDSKRTRRYSAEDVQKLKERKEQRKNPVKVAQKALHWGTPLLDSSLTLIMDQSVYYRGYDALKLAVTHTIEDVAALFWTGNFEDAPRLFASAPDTDDTLEHLNRLEIELPFIQRLTIALMLASLDDLAAYDLRPELVTRTGARILQLMVAVLANDAEPHSNIAQRLSNAWCSDESEAPALLNAGLILCADHELNVSSFTARVVASAEATPYQVVLAGLAAIQGLKHGGNTERVEALIREIGTPDQAHRVLAERLRRGERIPGFGHQLYPEGDPRGALLLRLVGERFPDAHITALARTIVQHVDQFIGIPPNIDFGLVVLAQALQLPPGAALAIFALGRTVGWLGHAIEQYQAGDMIRPRANYTGVPPRAE